MNSYVVITGRAGGHAGTTISVYRKTKKHLALAQSEKVFREQYKIATNITLQSSIAFEGTQEEAEAFYNKLMKRIEERAAGGASAN